jgi:hypothetical protein
VADRPAPCASPDHYNVVMLIVCHLLSRRRALMRCGIRLCKKSVADFGAAAIIPKG